MPTDSQELPPPREKLEEEWARRICDEASTYSECHLSPLFFTLIASEIADAIELSARQAVLAEREKIARWAARLQMKDAAALAAAIRSNVL